mmetsp:Transcript_41262/g.66374  ORF Transcript_41262/g.66374 Transcript_41262/m.66374 type:complete len:240 (+) Transcript_41262:2864-3583(+)
MAACCVNMHGDAESVEVEVAVAVGMDGNACYSHHSHYAYPRLSRAHCYCLSLPAHAVHAQFLQCVFSVAADSAPLSRVFVAIFPVFHPKMLSFPARTSPSIERRVCPDCIVSADPAGSIHHKTTASFVAAQMALVLDPMDLYTTNSADIHSRCLVCAVANDSGCGCGYAWCWDLCWPSMAAPNHPAPPPLPAVVAAALLLYHLPLLAGPPVVAAAAVSAVAVPARIEQTDCLDTWLATR